MSARRTTRPLSTALAAAVLAGGLAATAATSNCTPPMSKFFTPAPWPSWFIQK